MKKKIICLGDSLTYGYPYGPRFSWVYYVAQKTGLNLVNAGVNGDTLEDMARRFERDVAAREPAAVVILGGTNDAFCRDISIAETLYYLKEMLRRAREKEIEPIIGLPIPVDDPVAGPKLERISLSYREVAGRAQLVVLDFATPFFVDPVSKSLRQELYLDCVHPNQKGYEVMGETALVFFSSWISKK
ncbi:MAG: GDSL family lipase [Firmicutes bacterium]|nr:GDSL family lipase [Bacillota bacterium]